MRLATAGDAIRSDIDSLDAGGGTDMYPAMLVAKEMLEDANAKIRHMICLSDGQTPRADFEGLTQDLADGGITVSTVALGDADRHLMSTIAEIGKGRYYETNDPANVPQIFTSETMQASKSAIKEDLFGTVQLATHPMLAGFADTELPYTLGYVMTQPKPTAQLLLVAESGDPLLAVARFGLGTGLAYSSDLSERWGGEWLGWTDCGKFWGQILRGIIRKSKSDGVSVTTDVVGDDLHLAIRKTDVDDRAPQSQIDWDLTSIDDQGRSQSFAVRETGLGQYRATVPVRQRSNLTLRLRERGGEDLVVLHYDRPYPAEYNLFRRLPAGLERLDSISPSQVRESLAPITTRRSIANYFYYAALVCFLLSGLFRRL
jgi:hypothetical protein